MHEIAEAVLHLIGASGYSNNLRGGIVLTGAGSEILSCSSLFADMSGVNCRISYPHGNGVLTEGCEEIEGTSAAAQVSMISLLKDNVNLNCGEEVNSEPEPEPAAEEPEGERTDNLLQNDEAWKGDQEEKTEKNKKGKKPAKKSGKNPEIVWKRDRQE